MLSVQEMRQVLPPLWTKRRPTSGSQFCENVAMIPVSLNWDAVQQKTSKKYEEQKGYRMTIFALIMAKL